MPLVPQTVTLPQSMLSDIEQLIKNGKYVTISEFVRQAIKSSLEREKIAHETGEPTTIDAAILTDQPAHAPENPPLTIVLTSPPNTWTVGKVQRGQQLGGKLGFPTLNLEPTLLPSSTENGVYAGLVEYDDVVYRAAVHYGPRKTLGEWKPTLELHLLEFNKHIPGALVRFQLFAKLRETMKFDSLDHLKAQLAKDVAGVRAYFTQQK